ncbi:uncharacterized protein J3R85_017407 [Psidium guajava]|nr:uncharacterized protein J3R85_017407 [Psidium guajava]
MAEYGVSTPSRILLGDCSWAWLSRLILYEYRTKSFAGSAETHLERSGGVRGFGKEGGLRQVYFSSPIRAADARAVLRNLSKFRPQDGPAPANTGLGSHRLEPPNLSSYSEATGALGYWSTDDDLITTNGQSS